MPAGQSHPVQSRRVFAVLRAADLRCQKDQLPGYHDATTMRNSDELQAGLHDLARCHADLELFLLFGSRAREDAREDSDWDFGFIGAIDQSAVLGDLVEFLGTERIDLVNLETSGALIRFRAARDGVVIFDRSGRKHSEFWVRAVGFWCDAGPIIEAGYEAIRRRAAR